MRNHEQRLLGQACRCVAEYSKEIPTHAGINGCSLKTEENLQVVAQLPADRLVLETGGTPTSVMLITV